MALTDAPRSQTGSGRTCTFVGVARQQIRRIFWMAASASGSFANGLLGDRRLRLSDRLKSDHLACQCANNTLTIKLCKMLGFKGKALSVGPFVWHKSSFRDLRRLSFE